MWRRNIFSPVSSQPFSGSIPDYSVCRAATKAGDYFAVSIGCVACNVTYPVADIVAWNPSVAFRTYALPHAVYQNCVVGACGPVAVNAVLVGES